LLTLSHIWLILTKLSRKRIRFSVGHGWLLITETRTYTDCVKIWTHILGTFIFFKIPPAVMPSEMVSLHYGTVMDAGWAVSEEMTLSVLGCIIEGGLLSDVKLSDSPGTDLRTTMFLILIMNKIRQILQALARGTDRLKYSDAKLYELMRA
jgi:hypothetical protein